MRNFILRQVLGAVFSNAARRRGGTGMGSAVGGMGGLRGAALGSVIAGMAGRRGLARGLGGPHGALLAMLLPFAMQWVQRNGGIGAVLQRVQNRGYGKQAQSWMSTGNNDVLDADAVEGVLGREELERLSRELGVSDVEVKEGFAQILPEMVDQLTPDGRLRADADDVLQESIPLVEQELAGARRETERS